MNFKAVLFLLSFVFIQSSEAGLRCFNLFENKQAYAQVIDQLNDHSNKNIFQTSLLSVLDVETRNKSILQDAKVRYQAHKLGRLLKQLKNAGEWDNYEFDQFTRKLMKLSYLTTKLPSEGLSTAEKIIFLKAQHDILAYGLENFFFQGTKASPTVRRKAFDWFFWVFHDVRTRWLTSMFSMPKLNGRVLSEKDAAKLMWVGAANAKDVIEKYELDWTRPIQTTFGIFASAQGKHYFNGLSKTYNWMLVSAIFLGIPSYAYLSFSMLVQEGQTQATAMVNPLYESSVTASKVDQHQLSVQRELDLYAEKIRLLKQRDPTSEEMEIANQIISNRGSRN